MSLGISAMKRVIEPMELRRDALLSPDTMQFGRLLQMIQCEQPSADKAMSPIGQTLMQLPHLLHFSSIIHVCGLTSMSLIHDAMSSISIASVGQAILHAKHSITYKYYSMCKIVYA